MRSIQLSYAAERTYLDVTLDLGDRLDGLGLFLPEHPDFFTVAMLDPALDLDLALHLEHDLAGLDRAALVALDHALGHAHSGLLTVA